MQEAIRTHLPDIYCLKVYGLRRAPFRGCPNNIAFAEARGMELSSHLLCLFDWIFDWYVDPQSGEYTEPVLTLADVKRRLARMAEHPYQQPDVSLSWCRFAAAPLFLAQQALLLHHLLSTCALRVRV